MSPARGRAPERNRQVRLADAGRQVAELINDQKLGFDIGD